MYSSTYHVREGEEKDLINSEVENEIRISTLVIIHPLQKVSTQCIYINYVENDEKGKEHNTDAFITSKPDHQQLISIG